MGQNLTWSFTPSYWPRAVTRKIDCCRANDFDSQTSVLFILFSKYTWERCALCSCAFYVGPARQVFRIYKLIVVECWRETRPVCHGNMDTHGNGTEFKKKSSEEHCKVRCNLPELISVASHGEQKNRCCVDCGISWRFYHRIFNLQVEFPSLSELKYN